MSKDMGRGRGSGRDCRQSIHGESMCSLREVLLVPEYLESQFLNL